MRVDVSLKRLWLLVVVAFTVAAAALVAAGAAPAAPASLPDRVLETPNSELDGPPSLKSGLAAPAPCTGGGVALRPIWAKAADTFGLRWQVLAAITKIESDFGCNMGPSSAGAIGWTQFMPDTWDRWGMDADGDGKADPRNAVDAIFTTARYLKVTGAPEDYRKAIFAYNHADWYVQDVLALAGTFGEFDEDEVRVLSEFAREGVKLRTRLEDLRASVDAVPDKRAALERSLGRAKDQLREGQDEFDRRKRLFADAKQQLNDVTLEYISLTQGVAQGPQRPSDSESALLEYVVDTNPEDAVLVYQSASALLDQQAEVMERMRVAAERAADEQADFELVVADREKLVDQRQRDLAELEQLDRQLSIDLRETEQGLRDYRKLERKYARTYQVMGGAPGDLSDSPFVGSLEGLTVQERMVVLARAELKLGVQEQPMGSNDSPDIARYRTATAGNPGPGAWCAYFVSYLASRAGSPLYFGGAGHGAVAELRRWGQETERWTDTPRPGYLIVFPNHIGLVERVSESGAVTTIEGNYSNMVKRGFNRDRDAMGYIRTGPGL